MDPAAISSIEVRFRAAVELQRAGRDGEAEALYRQILAEAPGLRIATDNLCLALLAQGNYGEGFPLYEGRFDRSVGRVEAPELPLPRWRGEPVAGRSLLVWYEQGFGDQIMFARFVPELAKRGARLTMVVPPQLERLFSALSAEIIVADPVLSLPRHDFWAMPGSLPACLGTTLETLPAAPYLGPPSSGAQGVGLVTRGDPRHHNDQNRSLPQAVADELAALVPSAVSLAPEDTGARDFHDTAEIISSLRLVITVDTSVAHLAGSMGKPVWILLPAEHADWRWMRGRSDTPWYPTARLFRQPEPADWNSVLGEVRAALAELPDDHALGSLRKK